MRFLHSCLHLKLRDIEMAAKFGSLAALVGLSGALMGCHRSTTKVESSAPTPFTHTARAANPGPTDAELLKANVDESGGVFILEYHNISDKDGNMKRSRENFRKDLERLYKEGYRPVLLHDYLNNRIDVPLGMSPVIFTFDDALQSQFRYLPDGSVDPDCALGIMQQFTKEHPDFPVKATFYVLPDSAFGQPKWEAKKLQDLLALGCEIGNHTVTHTMLKRLSDEKVEAEIGGCAIKIHELAPNAVVDTLALPYGISAKNRALMVDGAYQGTTYHNRAVLLVGAGPAPSPVSKRFNPLRLPRVQATDLPQGSTWWLDRARDGKMIRYVSDGQKDIVSVPAGRESAVNKSALQGARLAVYR